MTKVFLTRPRRALTSEEKTVLVAFQETLGLITEFSASPSRETFTDLVDQTARYSNYPFFAPVADWIKLVQAHHGRIDSAKARATALMPKVSRLSHAGSEAIMAHDSEAIIRIGGLCSRLNQTMREASDEENKFYDQRWKLPLYVQNPWFFQTNNFIRQFEQDDIDAVMAIKPDQAYTYMDLPITDNFQHLSYWAHELITSDEPVEMTQAQFNKWVQLQYRDDKRFTEMMENFNAYVHGNSRKALLETVRLLRLFPEIFEIHQSIIHGIDRVYRGISNEDGLSDEDIIDEDRQRRFVATSQFKRVAELFAGSRGHLDRDNRTDGIVIEYQLEPDAILLDTSIFGGIFGEIEVVIDAQKAVVAGTTDVFRRD